MIYSYLIKNIEKNISSKQAIQEIISKIDHKIQITNVEVQSMQNFYDLLQNLISFISEKDNLYGKPTDFNYNYYFYSKINPSTTLRGIKPSKWAVKLVECLYIFMNKKYKDWDHFLSDYDRTLLWKLNNKFNYIVMKMTDEQLITISQVIEELDNWSSGANYELRNIYFWIKKTRLKILNFKARFQIEKTIEEIGKDLILKKEELACLHRELQGAVNLQSKI